MPHDLTEKNRIDRISISDLLYKRNEYDPFLKHIITGDEKWIIYNNVECKKSWSKRVQPPSTTSKAGLYPNITFEINNNKFCVSCPDMDRVTGHVRTI